MATIIPHIHFNGNTEEAFEFYRSVLGGSFSRLMRFKELNNPECILLSSHASASIVDFRATGPCVAIFGNEGAGTSTAELAVNARTIAIPMSGQAESLNLSAAASIVMFTLSRPSHG